MDDIVAFHEWSAHMTDEAVRYTSVETPVGTLWVGYDDEAICISMLSDSEEAFVARAWRELRRDVVREDDPPAALTAAIAGRNGTEATLSFRLDGFTPFRRAVLETVLAIPRGEVRTYGEVAATAGYPGAARAVGEVMRTNRIPVLIPCHRVVRAGGDTGRYSPDPRFKRELLAAEGALVDGVLKGSAKGALQPGSR
jgi:methylated-DNA-[protein]-cysteine S-methyltransferase